MSWYRVRRPAESGKPELPPLGVLPRECAAAAVWRGRVLVTNGNDAQQRFRDLVEWDPRGLYAEKHASAQAREGQAAVSAHSLATCDGRFFYQFGGWDVMHDTAHLARYDADERVWTEPAALAVSGDAPNARHFHTCVGIGRLLVLFGGYVGARSAWTDDLYTFNTGAIRGASS